MVMNLSAASSASGSNDNNNNEKKVTFEGKEISVYEYNKLFGYEGTDGSGKTIYPQHPSIARLGKLYEKLLGCQPGDIPVEQRKKELEKNQKLNPELFKDFDEAINKYYKARGQNWRQIWTKDEDVKVTKALEFNNKVLVELKKALALMEQMNNQWVKTDNDSGKEFRNPLDGQDRGDLGQKAKEIEQYRKNAKQEIESALNQEPQISNSDLEPENQGWEKSIWHSLVVLGEKEIDDIKKQVLADIKAKREAKNNKDKSKPVSSNPSVPNQNSEEGKEKLNKEKEEESNTKQVSNILKDVESDKITIEQLEELKKKFGTKAYKDQEQKIKELEKKAAENDPKKYGELFVKNFNEQLGKWKLQLAELSTEIQEKVAALKKAENLSPESMVKNASEVIEKISVKGATKQMNGLVSQATTFLSGAKKKTKSGASKWVTKIKSFINADNIFQQKAYLQEKSKVEKLLKDLESYSAQTTQPTKKTLFRKEVVLPTLLIAGLLVAATVVIISQRKTAKGKKIIEE